MECKEDPRILDIKQMLKDNVGKYGDRAAFWVKKAGEDSCAAITYKKACDDVIGLAASLAAHGMRDKRVAVIGRNSYEWAVSYLAAICGTEAAVPLDKDFCITELKYFLNTARCSCAIFSGELEDVFRQIGNDGVTGLELLINMDKEKSEWDIFSLTELIDEGRQTAASGSLDYANAQIIHDDLCSILFTAGTTGVPEAVNLSHKNIAAEIASLSAVLDITESDVIFSKLPAHSARGCIGGILFPFSRGASITYCEELEYNFEISALQGYHLTECASIAALSSGTGSSKNVYPKELENFI